MPSKHPIYYVRPNISPQQRELLASLVTNALSAHPVDSPEFEELYSTLLKLKKASTFSTQAKQ